MKSILKLFKSKDINSNEEIIVNNNNNKEEYRIDDNIEYNSKHCFINLPQLLIKEILTQTDYNDRVCFILVCKRWFQERDRYLETKNYGAYINAVPIANKQKSIDTNPKDKLYQFKDSLMYFLPHSIEKLSIKDILIDRYADLIDPIDFQEALSRRVNFILQLSFDKNISFVWNHENRNNISNSNIYIDKQGYKLVFGIDTNYYLNVKNMEFEIPRTIRKIDRHYFPPSLERLSIFNLNQEFDESLFPHTLKYLRIHGGAKIKGLPPNLEELNIKECTPGFTTTTNCLPQTLHTLIGSRLLLDSMNENRSLTKLIVADRFENYPLLFNLPDSLTDLSITLADPPKTFQFPKTKFIPPSVKNLEITILKTMDLLIPRQPIEFSLKSLMKSQESSQLKIFKMFSSDIILGNDGFSIDSGSLESLDMGRCFFKILKVGMIPHGVKVLSLPFSLLSLDPNTIPNTVETIIDWPDQLALNNLPQSVREISFYYSKFVQYKPFGISMPVTIQSVTVDIKSYHCVKYCLKRYDNDNFLIFSDEKNRKIKNFGIINILKIDSFNKHYL